EDHGVPGLDAESSSVNRDVRARLVDDRHDSEGNADLAQLEAVWQLLRFDLLAHRVGERDDVPDPSSYLRDTRLVEREPVEQRCIEARGAPFLEVGGVSLEDLAHVRSHRVCDRLERTVLRHPLEPRPTTSSALR